MCVCVSGSTKIALFGIAFQIGLGFYKVIREISDLGWVATAPCGLSNDNG